MPPRASGSFTHLDQAQQEVALAPLVKRRLEQQRKLSQQEEEEEEEEGERIQSLRPLKHYSK